LPRRILLLITDLEIGGTPTVVRELAVRLHAPPEVEVEVACLAKWGPVADQIRAAGLTVTALDARGLRDLPAVVRRLRDLVRGRGIDTVFSLLIHANFVAALASEKLPGVRFLQSIQTTQPRPRWHWWLQRHVQRRAEKVVVPSPSAALVATDKCRVPPERVVVIPNGVDLAAFEGFDGRRRESLARVHENAGHTVVGFLGRLDPVKRVQDLIDAVGLLRGTFFPTAELSIFGHGSERERLEERAKQKNAIVHFHGAVASPLDALSQVDVLVLPSEAEGFGLVLIEAMAAGVPVIGTDVPGIRDVIEHEVNGLLVPPRDPPAISAAIMRVEEDEAQRDRLIAGGRNTVRDRFNWDVIVPRYRELLSI
jgi:glycosyltransferase involved in cell wall biosynthesis